MRKLLPLFIATLSMALAQTTPPIRIPTFPPQLKQYLTLTDDQVMRILDLNRKLNEFQGSKIQRQAQLSLEIAQETAKPTLDPMALGIRYMELETIRRQITDEQRKTADQVRTLLNDIQKGKVGALQEVLRQYPTACDAIRFNLLPPALPGNRIPAPGPGTNIALNPWFDTGSFLSLGCPIALPVGSARNGDLSGEIEPTPTSQP